MNSERLKAIASKVGIHDVVLDVGCDHGYLSIILKKNKLCKEVYASDIKRSALDMAIKNFKKYDVQVETFLSNGFTDIPVKFNTAVIAGMGTNTILKILSSSKKPDKLIIASNNDYYLLRKKINEMGYKIVTEEAILENNHYYIILLCHKGEQKLNRMELKYGISNDKEYYKYLLNKRMQLIEKVTGNKKKELEKECLELKGLIERK